MPSTLRCMLLIPLPALCLLSASAMTSDMGQWRTPVASGSRVQVVKETSEWLEQRFATYGRIERVEDGRRIIERTQFVRLEPDGLMIRTSADVAGTFSTADVYLPFDKIDSSGIFVVPDLFVEGNSAIWVTADREENLFLFRWHILFNEKLDVPSDVMSSGARLFCNDPVVAQEIAVMIGKLADAGH